LPVAIVRMVVILWLSSRGTTNQELSYKYAISELNKILSGYIYFTSS